MLKLIGTVKEGQPVLVCVAGNLCSPEVFDQITLPENMARLYVDYLGNEGPWDMDSLGWQLIDQLKERCSGPIVLAGYSAGGVIAISAASKAPELFAGLVLSNTGPCSIGHGKPGFADELKANFDNEEYIRTFLASCFYEKPSPELLEKMWKYTRTADPVAAYIVSKSLREVDYRESLKAYKNPALIIHGALDTRRKMDSVAMIQQSLPQAETVLLQTGHTPMAEDVKGYEEALNRFLKENIHLNS